MIKAPEKESKVGFRRHNIRSMFNRTNSMRVRISFVDSTRRNNSYQPSFGLIYHTNERKLFTMWFSFFTQEHRHFSHDKTVNNKPNNPPCFKRPIMKTADRPQNWLLRFITLSSFGLSGKISWNSSEHDTNIWFQCWILNYMSEWVKWYVIEMQYPKSRLLKRNNLSILLPTCFIELLLHRLFLQILHIPFCYTRREIHTTSEF